MSHNSEYFMKLNSSDMDVTACSRLIWPVQHRCSVRRVQQIALRLTWNSTSGHHSVSLSCQVVRMGWYLS